MPRQILAPDQRFDSAFTRPPWRRSELDVGRHLGAGWDDQVDFLQGRPLLVGADKIGSTRPEYYHAGLNIAVEVKNWPLDRLATFAGYLRRQMAQRRWSAPAGAKHWIFFDLRGQRVGSLAGLATFLDQLLRDNWIEIDAAYFLLDRSVVQAF
jgi:hypothetical protein